jgi:hypothetical protein
MAIPLQPETLGIPLKPTALGCATSLQRRLPLTQNFIDASLRAWLAYFEYNGDAGLMADGGCDSNWVRFRAQVRADRAFYLAIFVYLDIAVLIALAFDRDVGGPLHLIGRMMVSIVAISLNMGSVWLGLQCWRTVRNGGSLRDGIWKSLDVEHLARFLMVPALFVFLSAFNTIKVLLPDFTDLNFDETLSNLDRTIHGGDPWRMLTALLGPDTQNLVQALYLPGWTYAVMFLTGYICVSRHAAKIRDQYITVFLVTWPLLGNVIAALFLSDGPAFYARVTGDHERYGALIDTLAQTRDNPFSAYMLQNALWVLQQTKEASEGSGISAFPSVHVAMATLVCLGLVALNRRYAIYGVPFLVSIFVGSILLGWHYAVDGYASMILVCGIWFVVATLRKALAAARADAVVDPAWIAPGAPGYASLSPEVGRSTLAPGA